MKRVISSVLLLASLIACDKDDNSYHNFSLSSVRMDIADAKMLALCGSGTQTKSSADDLSLFKIDKDGNMTAVRSMVDGTNEEIRLVPESIWPLSDEYILCPRIWYYRSGENYGSSDWNSYLINKKTGRMYVIDGEKYQGFSDTDFSYQIREGIDVNPRTDNLDNAYCLARGYSSSGSSQMGIYKFALENSDNITLQKINLDQFPIGDWSKHPFEVDAAGNCMTYVRLDDLGEKNILYKADGGLYEFPKSDGVFDYFVGYNGKMYCCSCLDKENYWENKRYKIFPLEIGVEVSYDLAQATSKETQTNYAWDRSRTYTLENNFIHVLLATDDTNNMLVYNSKDNTIKEVGFLPGEMEDVVGISNNCIYRIMNNSIYKYDFIAEEKSVTPIDFDFSGCATYRNWDTYNAPQGSKFILGAIRNSDMARLRIEVDMETGKSNVFEDAQDRPIVTLVQVGN